MMVLQVACDVHRTAGFGHKFCEGHLNDSFLFVVMLSFNLMLVTPVTAVAAAHVPLVLLTLLLLAVLLTVVSSAVLSLALVLIFASGGARLPLFLLFCGAAPPAVALLPACMPVLLTRRALA